MYMLSLILLIHVNVITAIIYICTYNHWLLIHVHVITDLFIHVHVTKFPFSVR